MESYTDNQELYKTYIITNNRTGEEYKTFTDSARHWIINHLNTSDTYTITELKG